MLRDYQQQMYDDVREAFRRGNRRVMLQAPTGAGKTILVAKIVESSIEMGHNVWFMVPRKELMDQASKAFSGIGLRHNRICPGYEESKAFDVHIVSKDTLNRRIDRVVTPPDFIVIDEAHLALDGYIWIHEQFPQAFILGVTATPERLDGRGLSDLYQCLVYGPTLSELVHKGYLCDIRYFCPPTEGLDTLHRVGVDFDATEVEVLLEKRKIYGKAIEHYKKHADGKPTLVFCKSLKSSEETARHFRDAGYNFENIDGSMSKQKRNALIEGIRTGKLHGITSCELLTYGLDVPRVECVIMLRPTMSKTIYFQSIGRGLRPAIGKDFLVVLDHVGNFQQHGHPFDPYEWNFRGTKKSGGRQEPCEASVKLCPNIDFLYCDKKTCEGCPHWDGKVKIRKPEEVDVSLVEILPGTPLHLRPEDQQIAILERIDAECERISKGGILPGPIGEMLRLSEDVGYDAMWAYRRMNKYSHLINVALLTEIARQKEYKPGWVSYKIALLKREREIKKRVGQS